ncbi:hypothetical protein Q5741_15270 [Paenibacillus sp. JX-17]|uniref:Lipoprotein n=2 Tax=Paenibacillus lacisoli TaxID=3064525 RepID=A0ABT9CEX9_9BACL|nr:hypothetical protein [Paenibacillus sp. JX-17]
MISRTARIAVSLLLVCSSGLAGCSSSSDPAQPDTVLRSDHTAAANPASSTHPQDAKKAVTTGRDQEAVSSLAPREDFYGVRLVQKNGSVVTEWPSPSYIMYQPVWNRYSGSDPQMLVYSSDGKPPSILLPDGTTSALAEPRWAKAKKDFGNDYGQNVQYADRIVDNQTFAVKGNRTLYKVNLTTSETVKLYESKNPIYGVAASPDNSRVALLVASDSFLGPDADLIVLDEAGRKQYSKARASYLSHSDGLLYIYPFSWKDNATVAVPVDGYKENRSRGKDYIQVDRNETFYQADEQLPVEVKRLLLQQAKIERAEDISRFIKFTDSSSTLYAVQLVNEEIWIIHPQSVTQTVILAGHGMPLRWTREKELFIGTKRSMDPSYYIGS